MKTVYCLRVRINDKEEWSDKECYRTRKQRDTSASVARIIGGMRTHSFEENISAKALEEIEFV